MGRPALLSPLVAPSVMTAKELRTTLRMTEPTFYRHQAAGDFKLFELEPRIGSPRYSRALVLAYINKQGR